MADYELIKRRRKTVGIRIDRHGRVTVIAPTYYTRVQADAFVREHADWIERKKTQIAAKNPLPELTFRENEKVPLFGKEYFLSLSNGVKVVLQGDRIYLPVADPRAALKKYYVRELKNYIFPRIAYYAREMDVVPTDIRITSACTRWGSCNGESSLAFCFWLAMCEPTVIDYVAVHELSHILHKNHSQEFWKTVERYYPDYREARKYLEDKAYFIGLF